MAKHLAKVDVPRYLSDKRARKAARRNLRVWSSAVRHEQSTKAIAAHFGRRSKIVALLANGSIPDKRTIKKHRVRITLPQKFSIIDYPEITLDAVCDIARQMRAERLGSLFLDFAKVSLSDLGANALLDVLVDELTTQAKQTKRRIRWRGTYPTDVGHRRFLKAMGVIKRLKIEHEYPTKDEEAKLALYNTRSKHYLRAAKPRELDQKGRVTVRFADHINTCLRSVGLELTEIARGQLCQYVSEIIDNAEEHSHMLDWTIQGYLDTHLTVPMCEIVIFNFGRTIANSLEELSPGSYTRQQIKKYIDMHEKSGFFQPKWRKEDLLTLIALQGNVSSKNENVTHTRGNGTVDLIAFFQKMHEECSFGNGVESARMAIVSGSTFILFDGKYKMAPNNRGIEVIAFNADNDLCQRPDSTYVRPLDGVEFPGTLISIKFPLKSTTEFVVGETA